MSRPQSYRWRRICWHCLVTSLETVCFVCARPMDLFTGWAARQFDE